MSYDLQNIQVKAYDLAGGEVLLPKLSEWELVKSFDSPARSFQGRFPCSQGYPELYQVQVFCGETELFHGFVDEQTITLNDKGAALTLMARSPGAVLLDNEAEPQVYTNVDLNQIYRNHVVPYEIYMGVTNINPFFNQYQVVKGLSEWEAFYNFLRSSQQGCAYLRQDDTIIISSTTPVGKSWSFSNGTGGGIPFASLRYTNDRYTPVSEFYVRDQDAVYSQHYENPKAQALKLRRKRYLIPAIEFTPYTGAGEIEGMVRVRHSMMSKEIVTLICPDLLEVEFNDRATVEWSGQRWENWFVYQVRMQVSGAGATTTLTLLNPAYVF